MNIEYKIDLNTYLSLNSFSSSLQLLSWPPVANWAEHSSIELALGLEFWLRICCNLFYNVDCIVHLGYIGFAAAARFPPLPRSRSISP